MGSGETRGLKGEMKFYVAIRSWRPSKNVVVFVGFPDPNNPSRSGMHRVQVSGWLAVMLHSGDDGTDGRVTAFSQWPVDVWNVLSVGPLD